MIPWKHSATRARSTGVRCGQLRPGRRQMRGSMSGEAGRKIEATAGVADAGEGEPGATERQLKAARRPTRGVTARAVALGIPLVALNAYWITVVEVRWYTLDGTSLPLFITPIFFLFCVCGLNALWRRAAP